MKSMCDTLAGAGLACAPANAASVATPADLNAPGRYKRGSRVCRAALLALVAGVVLPGGSAMAEGDPAAGAEKGYTCLGCHGVKHYVNTYPTYHVPRIAGQHREYLIAALQGYRAQTRPHPTMQANAGDLTDQDIEDIASWLSSQGAK